VVIVASPRPLNGKTFVARLVTDFLRVDGAPVNGFDLNPEEDSFADFLPDLAAKADIETTESQMALFDRLIMEDGVAKVIDLSHALFRKFFNVIEQIGFVEETSRHAIELIILYVADLHPASIRAYADLRSRFPGSILVPVFNEGIEKARNLRDSYPFGRAAAVPLQIPLLPPVLKVAAARSKCSFAELSVQLPMSIPMDKAFDLRSWTKRTFLEFRELELRLLLEKLRGSLKN
jgi:hypothetical protein